MYFIYYFPDLDNLESSVLNPGAVFFRFVTEAFLLFLAPAGGSNREGESLTLN